MKVSSPIGDLPFKPTKIKIKEGALHLEGNMGAWPAHVQIESSDILEIAYLIRYPLFVISAILVAIVTLLLIER